MDSPLRKQFSISDNTFTLLLIGKDGSVKAQQTQTVDLQKLFAFIDGMPMRQPEMKKK